MQSTFSVLCINRTLPATLSQFHRKMNGTMNNGILKTIAHAVSQAALSIKIDHLNILPRTLLSLTLIKFYEDKLTVSSQYRQICEGDRWSEVLRIRQLS